MGSLKEALLSDQLYSGVTIMPRRDNKRISNQMRAILMVMSDRQWHTLAELAGRIGGSEAGVSARLRDLRKAKFGSHQVDRVHRTNGLWEYRLVN